MDQAGMKCAHAVAAAQRAERARRGVWMPTLMTLAPRAMSVGAVPDHNPGVSLGWRHQHIYIRHLCPTVYGDDRAVLRSRVGTPTPVPGLYGVRCGLDAARVEHRPGEVRVFAHRGPPGIAGSDMFYSPTDSASHPAGPIRPVVDRQNTFQTLIVQVGPTHGPAYCQSDILLVINK